MQDRALTQEITEASFRISLGNFDPNRFDQLAARFRIEQAAHFLFVVMGREKAEGDEMVVYPFQKDPKPLAQRLGEDPSIRCTGGLGVLFDPNGNVYFRQIYGHLPLDGKLQENQSNSYKFGELQEKLGPSFTISY